MFLRHFNFSSLIIAYQKFHFNSFGFSNIFNVEKNDYLFFWGEGVSATDIHEKKEKYVKNLLSAHRRNIEFVRNCTNIKDNPRSGRPRK